MIKLKSVILRDGLALASYKENDIQFIGVKKVENDILYKDLNKYFTKFIEVSHANII